MPSKTQKCSQLRSQKIVKNEYFQVILHIFIILTPRGKLLSQLIMGWEGKETNHYKGRTMFKKMSLCLIGLAILSVNAQTINLQGVVSNANGKPIANAIVTLVRQKLSDTTDSEGKYAFTGTSIKIMSKIVPHSDDISIDNGVLQFALSTRSPLKVEIFNLKGNLLRREMNLNADAGLYRFDISKNCMASNVLFIKATLGRSEISFRYMPLNGKVYAVGYNNSASATSGSHGFASVAAAVDTLKVTAKGYQTKVVEISSLDNNKQNITLDTSSTGGKNEPVPSVGCGKTLGDIKQSGKYTVTSSGSNRSFNIDIPKNYDNTKPYRLIFAMHCMGGDANKVAGTTDQSSNFYHIKPLAEKDNIQCIYVAPFGNSDGTWDGKKDPQFFFDLQKLLKESLCVDTTRVFSVGFSFGAMFTYALSLKYPKILRAVACNAPANWNFDQPANEHVPIGYIQTTGTNDNLCSWVSNDGQKQGGKYCVLQHAEDNGCNTSITIQLANSGKHVVTEFTGCKDGYPVRFMSHNGQHECNKSDQGSNEDWIPVEFWNFFKRF